MALYLGLLAFLVGLSMVIADGGYGHGYEKYGHNKGYAAHGAKPSQHYGHYHYAKTTCADHYKPGIKDGHYKVYSVYHMGAMKVYCDFTSEPGMAYTMVMASSNDGRSGATVAVADGSRKNPFNDISLASPETSTVKHHVNSHIPNKVSYRQAFVDMERISKASKVWRYTCGAPENFKDYVRAKISVVNPVSFTTTSNAAAKCLEVEYFGSLNQDERSCSGCKVKLEQEEGKIIFVGASGVCDPAFIETPAAGPVSEVDDRELDFANCSGDEVVFWFGKPVH